VQFCTKEWHQWCQKSIEMAPAPGKNGTSGANCAYKTPNLWHQNSKSGTSGVKTNDRIRNELQKALKNRSAEDYLFSDRVNRFKPSIPRKGRLGGMVWNQCKLGKTNFGVSIETTTSTP
jgi:hypothetical protein